MVFIDYMFSRLDAQVAGNIQDIIIPASKFIFGAHMGGLVYGQYGSHKMFMDMLAGRDSTAA